ncbi:hypothetical protein [Reyranella sp.]|uniref:hypothetical protein n=1 Tax=Reyranella sp. TaxID=1929291 RepID=UPI003D0F29FD
MARDWPDVLIIEWHPYQPYLEPSGWMRRVRIASEQYEREHGEWPARISITLDEDRERILKIEALPE